MEAVRMDRKQPSNQVPTHLQEGICDASNVILRRESRAQQVPHEPHQRGHDFQKLRALLRVYFQDRYQQLMDNVHRKGWKEGARRRRGGECTLQMMTRYNK